MKRVLFLLWVLLGMSPVVSHAAEINVIPYPNEVNMKGGEYVFAGPLSVVLPSELKKEYETYVQMFLEKGIALSKKKKGAVRFVKNGKLGKEAYELSITPQKIKIEYNQPAGAFYALQTLKQLCKIQKDKMRFPCVEIKDEPAFPHRAFMLDEGREFKGKGEVKKLLDEMARLKLNVFHWHLCEERGWRIQIDKYPRLTEVGSKMRHAEPYEMTAEEWDGKYKEPWFYTKEEISEVVAYAAKLHIQVMPEIEIPGHTGASIMAYPWLGCASSKKGSHVRGDIYNVIDPKVEQFVKDVIDEIMPLFPMKMLHIGGDEAAYWSWEQDPTVVEFIDSHHLHNPAGLQVWFINKINEYLNSKGWILTGWNEITGDDLRGEHEAAQVKLDTTAVVQFWDGDVKLINKSIKRGYRIVNSNRFYTYLDYPYEVTPLEKCYAFDIVPPDIEPENRNKIIGLGAQMWGERMPTVQAMYDHIYPRIAALAESGWTNSSSKDVNRFKKNLPFLERVWRQKGYLPEE
ncbi:beta-N-acetylhexosaminidase [Parabacteroides pacaensis]|uniref:beta-N-acetylhexosaminidase n=1 Tax=Parabacteroides pacaensis TaxID=2086575 RepID=UPI000D0EF965|nr:beta-N-acetylhexosaminidase [Parabacteroides pacaensis]